MSHIASSSDNNSDQFWLKIDIQLEGAVGWPHLELVLKFSASEVFDLSVIGEAACVISWEFNPELELASAWVDETA